MDTCIGNGTLRTGRETVSELAERYDQSVNLQGERYDVKVAINGDYFSFKTDQPVSGQIIAGWFVRRFLDYSGGSGFVWTENRRCFLGGNVKNNKSQQRVTFADGTEVPITKLNEPRAEDDLVLYTHHWDATTGTSDGGVEALIRVDRPLGVAGDADAGVGRIVSVRRDRGSTPLAFDHVVLSAGGKAAPVVLAHARPNEPVTIRLGIKDFGVEDIKPAHWAGARASIGGHFYCVTGSRVPVERWEPKKKPGAVNRHPRTAVAFNDDFVYFVVADGRSEESVGMTITELGRFCAEHLAVTHAIAQDGGGSSTMWIDGRVVNTPSDGQQRPVANGYMMVLLEKPDRSGIFVAGAKVRVTQDTHMRSGPGTNYTLAGDVSSGDAGTVVDHPLNGIAAKGDHWWKCRFDRADGWLQQDRLTAR